MRPRSWLALAILGWSATAWGHANLLSPTPRNLEANKTGPCGVARTATPSQLVPGETITVTWVETIDHPGHYRIAWSPAADMGFDDNVIADDLPDVQGGTLPHMYTHDVTLPTTPCEDCTLQLIQVMTETVPPSNYYSCADIVLRAVGDDAGPPADASPSAPDAGPTPDSAPSTSNQPGDPPGLCAVGAGRAPRGSGWIWLLGAAALLLRRRNKKV